MKYYKGTKGNAIKIYQAIKAGLSEGQDFLTVGEISRRTGLHKWVVSRTIDVWMAPFLEVTIPEELEAVGVRMKLVRLKSDNITEEQIINGLGLKK